MFNVDGIDDFPENLRTFLTTVDVSEHKQLAEELQNSLTSLDGLNLLCWAAKNGHLIHLQKLLQLAVVYDQVAEKNNEALRWAALNGHDTIVSYLLQFETVREQVDALGNEALRFAAMQSHTAVISILLQFSAVFAYAESRENKWEENFVSPFITTKLASLLDKKQAADNAGTIFDITDVEETRLCFYIIRNLIRHNEPSTHDEIRFLLSIPAVRHFTLTTFTWRQDVSTSQSLQVAIDELWQTAEDTGNTGVKNILRNLSPQNNVASDLASRPFAQQNMGFFPIQDSVQDDSLSPTRPQMHP